MQIDLYTKMVLTVIAGCLLWMCVTGATPGVSAQAKPAPPQAQAAQAPAPQPVMLVDASGTPLIGAQGLRVTLGPQAQPVVLASTQPMPVTLGNQVVPVALRTIQQGGAWDPVFVRVLREPPTLMPTP